MDFGTAFKQLLTTGLPITRSAWINEPAKVIADQSAKRIRICYGNKEPRPGEGRTYEPTQGDMFARDWELYREPQPGHPRSGSLG